MNYYNILGIPEDADTPTIRRAFRLLVRRYHPDAGAGSSPERFRQIVNAYETLRDPLRRHAYDASLRAEMRRMRQTPIEPLRPEAEPDFPEPIRSRFRRRPLYWHTPFFVDPIADFLDDALDLLNDESFFRSRF